MNQALALLDKALELAHQEMMALQEEAYEKAVSLAEERNQLTAMAWQHVRESNAELYRQRLVELTRIQGHLSRMATTARDQVRSSLQRSRKEQRRMRGYKQSVSMALQ